MISSVRVPFRLRNAVVAAGDGDLAVHCGENLGLRVSRVEVGIGLEVEHDEVALLAGDGPDEGVRQQLEHGLGLLIVVGVVAHLTGLFVLVGEEARDAVVLGFAFFGRQRLAVVLQLLLQIAMRGFDDIVESVVVGRDVVVVVHVGSVVGVVGVELGLDGGGNDGIRVPGL